MQPGAKASHVRRPPGACKDAVHGRCWGRDGYPRSVAASACNAAPCSAARCSRSAARELRALHIRVLARHRGSGICTHCLASGGEVLDCLPQPLELHYPSLLRVTPPDPASPASSSPRNLWNLH